MNNTILTILSLSASGSVLALILLALRPLLKNKVSKTFQYYIWLLVLLRLALPLSFDGSIMSQIIPQTGMTPVPVVSTPDDGNGITQGDNTPQGNEPNTPPEVAPSGMAPNGNAAPNPNLPAASEPTRFNIWQFALDHLTAIWLLGAALYLGWFVTAYLRFSRKLRKTSIRPHPQDMEVYAKLRSHTRVRLVCNPYINTPMLIGFLSPCIVIPQLAYAENGMKSDLRHILRHELTHYRRRDLLYKWFVVLVSALHWFNPLMVLVRREVSRTCELSCDEAVIRSLDAAERQDYGETLLAIASSKRLPTGVVTTTMCEGKRELKERLESIMTYKSKSVFMVAVSLILALLLAGCSVALGAASVTQMPDEASLSPTATDTSGVSTSPDVEASPSPAATDTPDVSTIPGVEASQSPTATDASGAPTRPSSPNSAALEAYNAVLQNQAEFFSTDVNKNLNISQLNQAISSEVVTVDVASFAVIDIGHGGVPAVILSLNVNGNGYGVEVLSYQDGIVYGYTFSGRQFGDLRTDGTFVASGGAADVGICTIAFDKNTYLIDKFTYSESNTDSENNMSVSYFVNHQSATEDEYNAAFSQWQKIPYVTWYDFTAANMGTKLS